VRVVITTGIFPPDIGGPATYVPRIARALTERGHDVAVLTTSEPVHLRHPERLPFPLVRIDRRQPLWRRTLSIARHVARMCRSADVVYANGCFLETVLATRLVRRPVVMKIVGDQAWERASNLGWTGDDFVAFQRTPQDARAEALRRLRTFYARCADHVIVPSDFLRKVVLGWGVAPERCTVVPNGVVPDARAAACRKSEARALRVLSVGRLVAWKGTDLLVRAVGGLAGVTLDIVGDGPEAAALRALVREQKLAERVRFHGALVPADTAHLVAASDAFVLPSRYEGLPHAVLEAMAAGVPVVVTAAGGVPELMRDGETGLLVEPDTGAVARAIARLRDDDALRRRLGANAARLVRERFGLRAMIDRTEAILRAAARHPDVRMADGSPMYPAVVGAP
jgi:glycosyltransferase involved in cell wall biosynthesis